MLNIYLWFENTQEHTLMKILLLGTWLYILYYKENSKKCADSMLWQQNVRLVLWLSWIIWTKNTLLYEIDVDFLIEVYISYHNWIILLMIVKNLVMIVKKFPRSIKCFLYLLMILTSSVKCHLSHDNTDRNNVRNILIVK